MGEYVQTLDVTDRYSGWTETQAVRNKAQEWVFAALKDIRRRLPFLLRGIHSGGGSEFINQPRFDYCQNAGIEFTRSRSYNKNDNCHVEQKNSSVVRQAVRLEGQLFKAVEGEAAPLPMAGQTVSFVWKYI